MRRLSLLALFLGLVVPAASAAPPAAQNDDAAAKRCKTERGTTALSRAAFDEKHGTNATGKNAFGKCVASLSKQEDSGDTPTSTENAAKKCKAERGTTTAKREAFADTYGTNANGKNAFGKCVSKYAKEKPRRS